MRDEERYGWRRYVSAAERQNRAAREMQKLRKTGHPVSPVVIEVSPSAVPAGSAKSSVPALVGTYP